MGPLVAKEQLDRVWGYLESGYAQGARALTGGHKIDGPGHFIEPTVLVDTTPDMKVVREEIFGPVVTVHPFTRDSDVMPAANDVDLRAGLRDLDQGPEQGPPDGRRRCTPARSGSTATTSSTPRCPSAGTSSPGWGREMGHEVLNAYTQVKSVCMNLS